MTSQQRARNIFFVSFAALLASPLVSASTYNTGVSPLNRVVELISNMMNIPILEQPQYQVWFLRFCFFIVFLAIARYGFLKAGLDNKTAGIIATVFSIIAAFLMPEDWVTANGGVITAVFAAAIPLGLVAGGVIYCVLSLNDSTIKRIIAIVILLFLLSIIDVYRFALHLPMVLFVPIGAFMQRGRPLRSGRTLRSVHRSNRGGR